MFGRRREKPHLPRAARTAGESRTRRLLDHIHRLDNGDDAVTRDEDALHDLLSRTAPTFDSLDGTAVRHSTTPVSRRQTEGRWRHAALAVAGAAVVAATAITAAL